jgi:hypothetical protein
MSSWRMQRNSSPSQLRDVDYGVQVHYYESIIRGLIVGSIADIILAKTDEGRECPMQFAGCLDEQGLLLKAALVEEDGSTG